ncbi:Pleckstrin homology domain-containing protein [Trichophaea hybrida]|nr:Pleckstrin homology domain-containing protein [Trichophaea hybrida]
MSDTVVKPEDTVKTVDTLAAESAGPVAEETVVTEAPKTEESAEKKEEEAPKEEKAEPKAITHGTLSKTHGGLLSFFKIKRFFYFQDEFVPEDNLKTYLHKDNSSKSTAAHATTTGKGLWFYSKDEAHKVPHGVIKLADVTEVTESGSNKFVLKLSSGDLHFEAPAAERDSWVFTLKSKIAEAKASDAEITESETYKTNLEKFSKPASKVEEAKDKEVEETKSAEELKPEGVPETAVTSDEEAGPSDSKAEVKRSSSKKKRISGFIFGKKDKAEEKKEEKKDEEVKENKPVDATEAPAAPAPGATEPVAVDTEPVTEVKTEEEAKPAEGTKSSEETRPEPAPKKSNRYSFFSRLGKRDESTEEKKDKEVEPVKETPAETEADAKPAETLAETPAHAEKTPSSPKDLLSFFGKREKSPAPKAAIVPEETLEAKSEVKADAPTEPVVDAPKDDAAPAEETPAETATSPKEVSSPKEKRISNFFNFGKDKKSEEKKTEDVKSDSEDTEPVAPKSGFLGGLKRKVSKAGRSSDKSETKEVATPAPVVEEETPVPETTAEPVKTEEAKPEEKAPEAAPAIGDVVPEAVTVGAKPVQAAA